MSEIKLLPCPFCGGEAVLYHQSSRYTSYDGNFVHCIKCGCRTKLFECFGDTGKTHGDTEKEAIERWNTRKPMERILTRLNKEGQEIYREVKELPLSPFVPTGEKEILVRNAIRIVKEEGGIE